MTPTVLISDTAGFRTKRIPVTGVTRSWTVLGSGSLSAEILSADLVTAGLHDELRGHWIVCYDDDAGTWGGIVTDTQANGDGTTEVAATDWKASFAARRMPKRNRPLHGPAGTLALVAITETVRRHGTPITVRTADDIGPARSFDLNGGDLLSALDSLANESGQEWWVDPDTMAMHWGIKGRDKTGTVQLIAGRHISEWRLPSSIGPVVNDLEAFPLNDRYQVFQTIQVENAASIAAIGRRQGSAGIPGGSHAVHIRPAALALVDELAALGQAIECDVVNVDDCFQWFREGDTVCMLLPSASVQLTVRVMTRSLGDDRVMGVSGIVTNRRAIT